MNNVVIVSAKRTPIGAFGGVLAGFTAPELGASVCIELIRESGLKMDQIDEVVMGNVLSAGVGQAPARQTVIKAGLSETTPATTINKVCASGMKAVMIASDQIKLGHNEIMLAGGMESMSNVPYYLSKQRFGTKLGHTEALDGIIQDGLWDVYNNCHMGSAGELCAKNYSISREEQDQYAVESCNRALKAHQDGHFEAEIIPMKIRDRKGNVSKIILDEELDRINFDKIPALKPVFEKDGTITAANASSINDGAAGLLLMSEQKAEDLGLTPLARILSHASTAKAPEWFTTAPSDAIPAALSKAGLTLGDVDLFEINEAFSVVSIINNRLLKLDPDQVNIHGGAVSIGHPIGCSGARILVTLLHALRTHGKALGCAGICNGGGGASAMVIEMIS